MVWNKIIFSEEQSRFILENYNCRRMDKFDIGVRMNCDSNTILRHLHWLENEGFEVLWWRPREMKRYRKNTSVPATDAI